MAQVTQVSSARRGPETEVELAHGLYAQKTATLRPAALKDGPAVAAPLLRRLGRMADLAPEEVDQVRQLVGQRRRWRAGTTLFVEGRPASAQFLLSGWACSQRVLRDGRRQIFDFILPGEGFGYG